MKKSYIGLFDVIGPVMVGPSSSHTSGANYIAWRGRYSQALWPESTLLCMARSRIPTAATEPTVLLSEEYSDTDRTTSESGMPTSTQRRRASRSTSKSMAVQR